MLSGWRNHRSGALTPAMLDAWCDHLLAPMSAGVESRPRARQLAVLIAVSAVLLFLRFRRRVYTTNDETRFPLMARRHPPARPLALPRSTACRCSTSRRSTRGFIAIAAWPAGAVTPGRAAQLLPLLAALGLVAVDLLIGARPFGPCGFGAAAGLILVTTSAVLHRALARPRYGASPHRRPGHRRLRDGLSSRAARCPGSLFTCWVGVAFWIKALRFLAPGVAPRLRGHRLRMDRRPGAAPSSPRIGIGLLTVMVAVWGDGIVRRRHVRPSRTC